MLWTLVMRGRVAAWWCSLGCSGLLVGCAPALDWREVQPQDSSAVAMFPCKPSVDTRMVTLAGSRVRMSLAACRARDATWALAYADVADPALVAPALQALREGMVGNLAGATAPAAAPRAMQVPGMTPNPQAQRLRVQGRLPPQGDRVALEGGFFAHGTRVYQATAMGKALDDEAIATFFDGLKLRP